MSNIVHANFSKDDFCEAYVGEMIEALTKRYRQKQDTLLRNHSDHNQIVQLLEILPRFCALMLHDAYQNGCESKSQQNRDQLLNFFTDRLAKNVNTLEWHI